MPDISAEVAALKVQVSGLSARVDAIDRQLQGTEAAQSARHAENQRRLKGIEDTLLTHQVERNMTNKLLTWVARIGIALGSGAAGWHFRDWLPPHN